MKTLLAIICSVLSGVQLADANTVTVFDSSGTYAIGSPAGATLTGTVTVDVTAGTITNVDLQVTGFASFTDLIFTTLEPASTFVPARVYLNAENSSGNELGLFIDTTSSFLVGYAGGSILDAAAQCGPICNPASFPLGLAGGTLTSEVVATTPLPAALPLFAAGLGVMGWFGRRRKRKNGDALAAA
jgi:hypothetical protein